MEIRGELCHELLLKSQTPSLTYNEDVDFESWRAELKKNANEFLGLNEIAKNSCPPNLTIEEDIEKEGYRRIRFVIETEIGAFCPCYLLIPNTGKDKYPLAITLQGHSTGFHNSIGEPKYDDDVDYMPRGAFAVQAVENGFAALAIEQRAMGERRVTDSNKWRSRGCDFHSFTAMLLGRTVIGERCWDISRCIDALQYFKDYLDLDKIVLTGNSGGGTATYYASCFDDRIKIAVPSCAFCTYEESILSMYHCSCNYIPNARKYYEMQDFSALIAPRKLVLINGEKDTIFPITGVKKGYEVIKKIYKSAGCEDNCRLVVTPKSHWWCVDNVWPTILEEAKKLGWEI